MDLSFSCHLTKAQHQADARCVIRLIGEQKTARDDATLRSPGGSWATAQLSLLMPHRQRQDVLSNARFAGSTAKRSSVRQAASPHHPAEGGRKQLSVRGCSSNAATDVCVLARNGSTTPRAAYTLGRDLTALRLARRGASRFLPPATAPLSTAALKARATQHLAEITYQPTPMDILKNDGKVRLTSL